MIMKYGEMKRYADEVRNTITLDEDLGGGELMELLNHARTGGIYDIDKIYDSIITAYYLGVLMGRNGKTK